MGARSAQRATRGLRWYHAGGVVLGGIALLGAMAWLAFWPRPGTIDAAALATRFDGAFGFWLVGVASSAIGLVSLSFAYPWGETGADAPPSARTLGVMLVVTIGAYFVTASSPISEMAIVQANDARHDPANVLAEMLFFAFVPAVFTVVLPVLAIFRPWRHGRSTSI